MTRRDERRTDPDAEPPAPASKRTKAAAERLEQQPEVQEALQQTATARPPEDKPASIREPEPIRRRHKLWLFGYAAGVALFAGLAALLHFGVLATADPELGTKLRRIALGAAGVVAVLGIGRALDAFAIERIASKATRFNLRRVLRLVAGIAVFLIVLSVVFATWYTAVVSLGLISLILGFALQTPITSFIGWIYLLVRAPYRVGDRIRIGEALGDVIDVGYLDTTLWEVGGDDLSTQHPSGRIIRFPNSTVLSSAVYNYSWPLFPYVWNEVKFQIAYDSDLDFVAKTMQQVAEAELGKQMLERIRVYRELLGKTPVDQVDVQERPSVQFRSSENTWLEAIVRYLVEPHEAGRVKTRLIKALLAALNAAPDRVQFPKSNMR